LFCCVITGLERVAEELMGRRRWRQYQAHILGETATAWEKAPTTETQHKLSSVHKTSAATTSPHEPAAAAVAVAGTETQPVAAEAATAADGVRTATTPAPLVSVEDEEENVAEVTTPKDWQPEDRCYFCDGAVHTEPSRVSLVNPALCVAHPNSFIIFQLNTS
jgi:hypothetical protein